MSYAHEMLKTHPHKVHIDDSALAACTQACFDCAQACTACADACLGERDVERLVRCIRLNQDCADVCDTTGRLISRQVESNWELWSSQLEACAAACEACALECERHAQHHEHCRVCAEACRQCETACNNLLAVMAAVSPA